ncbi:alpha-ketoacid dehydrogenase subunit beta [Actinomadura chibensis]|nr:transketolase C-terminal domain-containing protein [Actinomadura chibensis]
MSEAIVRAVADAMERDPSVYLIGQDVGVFGGPMNSAKGLWERFGDTGRIIDAPISEAAMVGTSVGAAMAGARPVVDLMFAEFLTLAVTPLGLEGASVAYRTRGRVTVPLVVRAKYGVGPHRGHAEGCVGMLMGFPGLKLVAPATPQDAYSLMAEAIADANPVVFLEHMSLLHAGRGEVDTALRVPIGAARVASAGTDLTIAASGLMVRRALRAATALTERGVSAEVVDLRTIVPLDVDTVLASARRTGRLLIVDESWPGAGPASELCSRLVRATGGAPGFTIEFLTPPSTPVPFGAPLEKAYVPDVEQIVAAASTPQEAFQS